MAMKRKSYVEGLTRGDGMETMPKDFSMVVKDIKLAILQARAKAARIANAEALKLYFFVGGYISKKTRNAKWGSGAIDALSNRLQVELPGLRGFSPSSIKNMRAFFEFWADDFSIRHLSSDEIRQIPSAESALVPIRQMPSAEIGIESVSAFLSVGFSQHREIIRTVQSKDEAWYYICASAKAPWSYEQLQQHLRADDYHHIGALPNNFEKTLSPMALASKAVRSFRDEYLLELVNLDNVDAVHDQDIDERVLSKELVANIEKTISALGGNDFCFMGREKR
jgi:predicted nuclease of restriction endonuclease-like (RecB) superfamily